MNNPLASPHFRAETQMGDYFRVVREVHANLKELKLLASNFYAIRSGNIELAIDDNLDFKYKYQLGNEWYVMANMADLFTPLQTQIDGINAKLVLVDSQLSDLSGIISTINNKISNINSQLDTLAARVTALEQAP